jgi:endonuclease/exonuclease/phosphatase family metal-dependent hydrolase
MRQISYHGGIGKCNFNGGPTMLPLKIMSWNIEHFNGAGGIDRDNRTRRLDRVDRVLDLIETEAPDVFGLSEVEGKMVYEKFTNRLSGYTLNITEGPQSQEILVGVRSGLTAFFTQKNEFRRNNLHLRPAALLTIRDGDMHVPILFTHLKSAPSPEGFGLRDAMFLKVFELKKKLDKAAKGLNPASPKAHFIVAGDMNTMGLDYESDENDIAGVREIEVVKNRFRRRGMNDLSKSHPHTYNNGSGSSYPPSDLDHVFAARHLQFRRTGALNSEVRVAGWAEQPGVAETDAWINAFSDHAPLIFILEGVGGS